MRPFARITDSIYIFYSMCVGWKEMKETFNKLLVREKVEWDIFR